MDAGHTDEAPLTETDVFRYSLSDGWEILAGRNARANDLLSLRAARPNDYWFHVRGMPGSHVLLRKSAGGDAPKAVLAAAAAAAAYHSKARNAGRVAVSCTRAKFVSKRRGASPGSVNIRKEQVIKVRPGLPEGYTCE